MNQRQFDLEDVIAAQASAVGGNLRGIIRVSGLKAYSILTNLFISPDFQSSAASKTPRRYLGNITSAKLTQSLPAALYWWPTGKSFTGQPLGEIHLPGSPPLINLVLEELFQLEARPANPGEFTLRAFLHGKLDLVQAEAVLGVIDARTDHELHQALSQLAGGISHELITLRSDLLNDLADLEAGLDFVDEDLDFVSRDHFLHRIKQGKFLAEQLLEISSQRLTSQALPKVVLAGLPNAGKSTLFNHLAESSIALISPLKGTTRDYLAHTITWEQCSFELIDTAGCEITSTGPDAVGQSQRIEQLTRADLVIWCQADDLTPEELHDDQQHLLDLTIPRDKILNVKTKSDLLESSLNQPATPADNSLHISCVTNSGMEQLKARIQQLIHNEHQEKQLLISSTAARCKDALHKTIDALSQAIIMMENSMGDEMIALEIRTALEAIGEITGEVYTNDLLDRIFSRFCIGK